MLLVAVSTTMFTRLFSLLLYLQERAAADNCRGLNEQEGGAHDAGGSPIDAFAWGSIVLGKQLDISSEFDRRLSIGASIACRLRGAIRKQLGKSFPLIWYAERESLAG